MRYGAFLTSFGTAAASRNDGRIQYPFLTRFSVSLILKDIPGSFCEFSTLLSHISLGAVPVRHDNGAVGGALASER